MQGKIQPAWNDLSREFAQPGAAPKRVRQGCQYRLRPVGRVADAAGRYTGLLGFNGEDAGMGTYTRLAFSVFGINLPALTYGYFAIVLISLVMFAASHHGHRGALVAAGLLTVALYLVVCSSLFNFTIPGRAVASPGIDLKDPRFLSTLAALPLLHIIVTWIGHRTVWLCAIMFYLVRRQ